MKCGIEQQNGFWRSIKEFVQLKISNLWFGEIPLALLVSYFTYQETQASTLPQLCGNEKGITAC
jgi:hypothetical protein